MKKRLSEFARVAADFSARRDLFRPLSEDEPRVIVALSGGPDSCALLLALIEGATEGLTPRPVAAAHFHHGLRGADANADAAFCAALCARLQIPCLIDIGAVPRTGNGAYANDTARRMRYDSLVEAARKLGANILATAHTADDQAETVLGRVFRGASVDGIAGIPARRSLTPDLLVVRPLLLQRRSEVEAYCHANGIVPRHDPSNDKENFPRVRLRRQLPELATLYNPRLTEALMRLANLAAEDATYLTEKANILWSEAALIDAPSHVSLQVAPLRESPAALRRRVLLRAIRHACGDDSEEASTFAFVERLETLLQGERGSVSLPGDIEANLVQNNLILKKPDESVAPLSFNVPLPVPGDARIESIDFDLTSQWISSNEMPPRVARSLNIAMAFDEKASLLIRPTLPGEHIAPLGMNGRTRRIRDMMSEAGWSASRRNSAPLVVCAVTGRVLWIVGLAQAEETRVLPSTQRILSLNARFCRWIP